MATLTRIGRRRIAFYVPIVLYLVLFAVIAGPFARYLFTGWWLDADALGGHLIHDVAFSAFAWVIIVGVVSQFWRPERNVAGVQIMIIMPVVLAGAMLAGDAFVPPVVIFVVLGIIAGLLHPESRRVFGLRGRIALPLAVLALIAGAAAIPYAWDEISLQRLALPGDEHAEFGHWAIMAATAIAIPLLGLAGALRPTGWLLLVACASAVAFIFGLLSVFYPHYPSGVGVVWGAVAILWAVMFAGSAWFQAAVLDGKRSPEMEHA